MKFSSVLSREGYEGLCLLLIDPIVASHRKLRENPPESELDRATDQDSFVQKSTTPSARRRY